MNEDQPKLPAPEGDLAINIAGASLRQKSSELRIRATRYAIGS